MTVDVEGGSFRDPSGFVYRRDGELLRQVNEPYREDYDHLMDSGLYRKLVDGGLMVPHEEVALDKAAAEGAYKVLRPEPVAFVSYPYEWSFSQLKDAALLTLRIQKLAVEHGMRLKDATAYNVQFVGAKPVFIDTLSFERLPEGEPWVAYRQFCQHFLAPLALMSRVDVRLNGLLAVHVDGVPLDLASSVLPRRTRLNLGLLTHVHMHAKSQAKYADKAPAKKAGMSRRALEGLVDHLESTVRGLRWKPGETEWGDYYDTHNYSAESFDHKKQVVGKFLDAIQPERVWDLGANAGVFSRLAAERGAYTVAWDIDPVAVDRNFREAREQDDARVLPLLLDLTNPSPGIGWANEERDGFAERGPTDAALALALVHHLAIGNNVPLPRVAAYFARLCEHLVIEWVPKGDAQVQRLLRTREDVFDAYTREAFEQAFGEHFRVEEQVPVGDSGRILYRMVRTEG